MLFAYTHPPCTYGALPRAQGLVAVVSRGGMIKVSGAPGVELVLEEEGSFAIEDPPAHLLFPTPRLLVGVTAAGAVLAWDLVEGLRCGHLSSLLDSARFSDSVTSVHAPDRSSYGGTPEAPAGAGAASDPGEERYIFIGLESGRVRVVQVLPVLRASGYVVEPRNMSSGVPEELLGSDGSGGVLGAVTSITSFRDRDGGGLALFGFRHGGIVLWDWVRRKRLAVRGLTRGGERREGEEEEEDEGEGGGDGSGEVTGLAFHPTGEVFAAGFSSGCYAVFPASSSNDLGPPRWVSEVGDDGLCPREGPTIVRTAVSLVRWVSVRGGAARAWGLLVAGGVEIDEGEEPDGVSLLVPPCAPEGGAALTPSGGGRAKKKELVTAALAPLETAVFVPFAIGQERLSSVHCASSSADGGFEGFRSSSPGRSSRAADKPSSAWFKDIPEGGEEGDSGEGGETAEESADLSEELVVLGLVTWNEEVRGDDGRLQFRRASSVQACPIQTSPYVALLQLAPEKTGPHLSGFAPVTAVASTPLLSSATILDFMVCVAGRGEDSSPSSSSSSSLFRGGGLKWPDSVAAHARDEALCTSEMLVVGHSNGCLSFWECCGPASRQSGVSISEGRVSMREVPSGASLLGSLPAAELAGAEGEDAVVTALDVWIERDHVAAAERNACWVAVGFGNGNVIVLVLSSRMEVEVSTDVTGVEVDWGGGTPLAKKPVTVSNVRLGDSTAEDDSTGGGGGWKRLIGRGGHRASFADKDEDEDDEISAAIAAAQAEARRIEALEDSGDGRDNDAAIASPRVSDDGIAQAPAREGEGEKEGDQGAGDQEANNIRQELSEAMAEEGAWGDSPAPPVASKPPTDSLKEDGGKQQRQQKSSRRKASLVQLALHLHGHPVRCVTLSYDAPASSLALVVADAEGVVSVTDVSTGSASLLPIRVPQSRPCYPSLAIGPLPSALCKPQGKQEQEYGEAGALFVFMEGWLNVFDLASRDPIDVAQVPGLAPDGGSGGGDDGHTRTSSRSGGSVQHEESAEAWLTCIDERGVPLTSYVSEPLSSFSPLDAAARQDSELGEEGGDGSNQGGGGSRPRAVRAQTTWVSPSASRTALESHHDHELQMISGAPPPRPLLLVVRGAVAAVLAITDKDPAHNNNPLSRRRPASPTVAPFRGRSGAALVVKSRATLPPAEGRGLPPRVDRAGVCMVAAGKAARRGCLLSSDTSGFVTGMLLPSLSPVFRDRLPGSSSGSGPSGGAMALAQKSVCNLVGELTIQGAAGVSGENQVWSYLVCFRLRHNFLCKSILGCRGTSVITNVWKRIYRDIRYM